MKGGRLTFKGWDLATRTKSIDKKHKKKKKSKLNKSSNKVAGEEIFSGEAAEAVTEEVVVVVEGSSAAAGEGDIYTIDEANWCGKNEGVADGGLPGKMVVMAGKNGGLPEKMEIKI